MFRIPSLQRCQVHARRFLRPFIPTDPRYSRIAKGLALAVPTSYFLDRTVPFFYDQWRLRITEPPTYAANADFFARYWTPIPGVIERKIWGNSFKPPEDRPKISEDNLTFVQLEELRESSKYLPDLQDLVYVQVPYTDFAGRTRMGELVCHRLLRDKVVQIFCKMHQLGFPIQRMYLIEDYGTSDDRSMEANNTTALCMRTITNKDWKWSNHSRGIAFDINPARNPYVHPKYGVEPKGAKRYTDRSLKDKGMITDEIVAIWKREGFEYGGDWKSLKDWHHFEFPIEKLSQLEEEQKKTV